MWNVGSPSRLANVNKNYLSRLSLLRLPPIHLVMLQLKKRKRRESTTPSNFPWAGTASQFPTGYTSFMVLEWNIAAKYVPTTCTWEGITISSPDNNMESDFFAIGKISTDTFKYAVVFRFGCSMLTVGDKGIKARFWYASFGFTKHKAFP